MREAMPELLEQYPWLLDFIDDEAAWRPSASSTSGGTPEAPEKLLTADVVLDSVWEALAAKRKEWETEGVLDGEDFVTFLRGGKWTAERTGQAFDCVVGQAKKGAPTTFCALYKLNKMASFSLAAYGEVTASTLAVEWCRRMQYFYNIWLSHPEKPYVYSKSDLKGYKPGDLYEEMSHTLPLVDKARARMEAIDALLPGAT